MSEAKKCFIIKDERFKNKGYDMLPQPIIDSTLPSPALQGLMGAERLLPSFTASKPILHQNTLASSVHFKGIGVHSGKPVQMTIKPAPVETGIVFIRTDLEENNIIKAHWSTVSDTSMSTRISNPDGVTVSTIEHVMAALAGLKIQNAIIELDSPEVPIMDGSSVDFVKALKTIGPKKQSSRVQTIRVLKTIQVSHGTSTAFLLPSNESRISMEYNNRLPESFFFSYYPDTDDFSSILSPARTFGHFEDAQKLRAAGLALGASLDNTIVIGENGIMNEGGLRYEDEFVRHKVLDAVGDLALAGGRLLGHFYGINSGHALNNKILRTLFADPAAWVIEETNENNIYAY